MDCAYILILATLSLLLLSPCNPSGDQKLFRAYIGAESDSVKLSDVPMSPGVEFHFILAFAIDYTNEKSPSPTDGKFKEFWETTQLTPAKIAAMKNHHKNVKVIVSLGGDSVGNGKVFFSPESIDTWVENAVSSLTTMIETYHLDGIDIDYEHFKSDPDTFAECIGKLVTELKQKQIISSASIAPYDDEQVQSHYMALWGKYGNMIDYVNFQFYAYDKLSISKFIGDFHKQASNYEGGRILASFTSNGHGGLGPKNGFFQACRELKKEGKLAGIFVWCADESKKFGFRGIKKAQHLLKFTYDLL